MQPVIVEYRSAWAARAAKLGSELRAALPPTYRRIDHIGSTSIFGMAAKDVLDFQISVASLDDVDRDWAGALTGLGFERSPYERDHVPAGRPDAPEDWAKRLFTRRGRLDPADDGASSDVNLHVRRSGAPNERLALLFRDWFRAHPDAVPAYSSFKLRLARAFDDTEEYADAKDPVVDLVNVAAEGWAAAVGWQP